MENTEFLTNLLRLLNDATFIPFLATGVVLITNVVKWALAYVPGVNLPPALIALAVQVVVWLAYTFARNAGVDLQFTQWFDTIVKIAEILFPLVGSMALGHVVYERARAAGNPWLGYAGKRS